MSEKDNPKILIISSVNPLYGPGSLALSFYNALRKFNIDVDLLTKDTCKYHKKSLLNKFITKIYNLYNKYFFKQKKGYHFFYKKEIAPPFPIKGVIQSINKNYDIVLIVFWQELLTYKTIQSIYEKLQCQIHFLCVDYSPMTGGCHFTGNCIRFQIGCGKCPALYSSNCKDFTHFNIKYRQSVLEKVKPIIYGNTYMINNYFKKSYLLRNYDRIEHLFPLIDNDLFSPKEKDYLLNKYQIDKKFKFICFFGAQGLDDERKGMKQLLQALEIFYRKLSQIERQSVLIIFAGKNSENINTQLPFQYKYMGYVPMEVLPELYSISSVFLCPSINDAGPTMVNQSLSCGTPVVSFEIGTAIDVIKGKNTGYCATPGDPVDFAEGINSIYKLSEDEYVYMKECCRNVALQTTSEDKFISTILSKYKKYLNRN